MLDVRTMIRQNYTPEQARNALATGWCSRREYNRYVFLWTWSAVRFASIASAKQNRFAERFGMDALNRRIDRTKRAVMKIAREYHA